jgi:uncharacterized protein (TIGR03083 family)
MAVGIESPINQLDRSLAAVGKLISSIRPEQWSASTPRSDWTVRQIVNHLVGMNRVFAAMLSDEPPHCRVDDIADDELGPAYRESAARLLAAFDQPGVLDAFTGVAVPDRYSLYDHPSFGAFAGHQLCTAHLLRDIAEAAECWPAHHWPAQADRALRGLIRGWHHALERGQPSVTGPEDDHHRYLFHQAVLVGLSQILPAPAGRAVKQLPARSLLECLHDREDDVLRFTTDTRIPPTNN